FESSFLHDLACFLDSKLDQLDSESNKAEDPDAEGVYDRAEYIVGLGFAACQQYMTTKISYSRLNKKEALDCGPFRNSDIPIAAIVNNVANLWKHSAEWSKGEEERRARKLLLYLGVDHEYPDDMDICSHIATTVLHHLLSPLPNRFQMLIPSLMEWRNQILNSIKEP
ncbi:MAG: hypothetical protein KJ927_08345, partial [Candidatus Eisenbacteria bacterium]|nr:hypothetical protein [Candidatus Eisenbacteria bacterium]